MAQSVGVESLSVFKSKYVIRILPTSFDTASHADNIAAVE